MRRNIKRKFIATLCAVTMIVGNMSISTYADDAALKITKQPTDVNPTVAVNKDDATYQWYKAEEDDKYAVEDIAGTIVDDTIIATPGNSGDMNCEVDGVWTGYNMCVYVVIKAGDVIKVTQLGDYADAPSFLSSTAVFEDDGTGVYTYTATSDFIADLCIAIESDVVSGEISIVRDGVTYQVVNGMDEVVDGKMMGNPGNATFSDGFWRSNSYGYLSFDVYLKEGQILKVTGDEDCFADMECWALMGESEATVSCVDNVYMYRTEEDGIYRIGIDNGISCKAKVEVIDIGRGQAVAGQTTNTLTSVEEGEQYSCLVTCGEEKVWSDYITAELVIVKQPTTTNPTVEVNYPSIVNGYQWYMCNDVLLNVVDSDDAEDDELDTESVWDGDYYDGIWYSADGMIDLSLYSKKGDKIIITLSENFEGVVYNCNTNEPFEYVDGGYEGYIVEDDGYINLTIESNDDFTANIQVVSSKIGEAVDGDTSATLENFDLYKTYVCKVIKNDGTEIFSDFVEMKMEFIKHPTAGNPTVEVNYPDAVTGYQWYSMETELLTVVEGGMGEGEIEIDYNWKGIYDDGMWGSENYLIDLAVVANRGDKVIITLPDEFDGDVYEYDSRELFTYTNGVYEYVIDNNDGYINFSIAGYEEYTAKIQVETYTLETPITGETTATLNNGELGEIYACEVTDEYGKKHVSNSVTMELAISSQPAATNPTVEVNYPENVDGYQWYEVNEKLLEVVDENVANSTDVIGTEAENGVYEDGVWISENYANSPEFQEIMVSFEVEEGWLIKVVPSVENLMMAIYVNGNRNGELLYENGVYYVETDTSGEYKIGLLALEEFTANITIENVKVSDAIAGQTTNKLLNHKAGKYMCEVLLDDGTTLLSDIVTITDADITHTYTDEYDAECNDCGAIREVPERDEDTDDNGGAGISGDGSGSLGDGDVSPNTGDSTNIMLLFTIAMFGVVSAFAVNVAGKRKYQG